MSIYSTTLLQDGPIAWYRLGEFTGSAAADSSGSGLAGTYQGGCALGLAGAIAGDNNAAAAFDGSSGYVSIPNNAAFDLADGLTVECWMKVVVNQDGILVAKDDSVGSARTWAVAYLSSGVLALDVFKTDTNSTHIASTSTAAGDGNWHHVALTYSFVADGTSIMTLYIDGAVDTQLTNAVGPLQITATEIEIARRPYSGSQLPFAGQIDEVAIHGAALSSGRIQAHYNAGIAQGIAAAVVAAG